MRISAQLALPLDVKQNYDKYGRDGILHDYIFGDDWWAEQKLDGERLLLHIEDGNVTGINRRDNETKVEKSITEHLFDFNGNWILDGEYLGGVFWAFDLPLALDKISPTTPFKYRRAALEIVHEKIAARTDKIRLLESSRTWQEKHDLLTWTKLNNAEGVMLKHIDAPYYSGKRSPRVLKVKWWESVDCIVTEVGREGKCSVAIGLADWPDIGGCKVTEKMLQTLQVNDVIEVKYLYATNLNILYQPSFLRMRKDKTPEECTLDQLKHFNKQVRTSAA